MEKTQTITHEYLGKTFLYNGATVAASHVHENENFMTVTSDFITYFPVQKSDLKPLDWKEYGIVTRPFYREQRPSLNKITALNEEDAVARVMRDRSVKEILDVHLSTEIIWDETTIEHYWNMYK